MGVERALAHGTHVRIRCASSFALYVCRESARAHEDVDDGVVKRWLETTSTSDADVSDEDVRFRIHVNEGDDGYVGFEHVSSGLMVQRRQRKTPKLVCFSSRFGVNEQFTWRALEGGAVEFVNRRHQGSWVVYVEVLSPPSDDESLSRATAATLHGVEAVPKPIESGVRAMHNVVAMFTHTRASHANKIEKLRGACGVIAAKTIDRRIILDVFNAWRTQAAKTAARKVMVKRAANMFLRREVLTSRLCFEAWRDQLERKKLLAIKADSRYTKVKNRLTRSYFGAWKNKLVRDKWCRLAVLRCLAKSKWHMKIFILDAWRREVDTAKQERVRRKRAERMLLELTNNKLYSAFYAWRDETVRVRLNDKRALQCLTRLTSRIVFKAFEQWRAVTEEHRVQMTNGQKAISWLLVSTQRKFFMSWVAVARENKRLRKLVTRHIYRRKSLKLYRAFHIWQEFITYEKSVNDLTIAKARRRHDQRVFQKAFSEWRGEVENRKNVREHAYKMAEQMRLQSSRAALALAFWGWASLAINTRNERMNEEIRDAMLDQKREIFDSIRTRRLLRFAYSEWREFALKKNNQRLKLTWAINRLTARLQFAAFESWYDKVQENKRQRKLMRGAVSRATNRLLSQAFNAWRVTVEDIIETRIRLQKIESIVALQSRGIARERLTRAFSRWREYAVRCRQQRKTANKVIASIKMREQTKAFMRWKEATTTLVQQRKLLLRAAQKMRQNHIRLAFDKWVEATEDSKRYRVIIQRAVGKISHCKLSYAFSGWLNRTYVKQRQRKLLNRAVMRISSKRLYCAFSDWVLAVSTAQRERAIVSKVIAKAQNITLSRLFAQWKRAAGDQRREVLLMDLALTRLIQRVMFKSFNAWYHSVQMQKRYRAIIGRCLERARDRSLRGCFELWASVARETKAVQAEKLLQEKLRSNKLLQLMGNATQRTLGYYFVQWRENAVDAKMSKVREAKAMRVCARIKSRSIARAFARWAQFAEDRRLAIMRAQNVIQRMRHRLLSRAFTAWFEGAQEQFRSRVIVAKFIKRLRYRESVRTFNAWKTFVQDGREERARERRLVNVAHVCVSRMQNRCITRAFNGWSGQVIKFKRQRELISKSLQRMRRRQLTKCLLSWSSYVRQMSSFRVTQRRLDNMERAIAPLHVTHASVSDMVRVNVAIRWGVVRNIKLYRNPMCSAWAAYVRRISAHRLRMVNKMHDILANRTKRKVLRSWLQYVDVIKYRRLRVAHVQKRVIRSVFNEWKLNTKSPTDDSVVHLRVAPIEPRVTGWDFDKSYEENIRALQHGSHYETTTLSHAAQRSPYSSRYSTPTGSPITIRPIVVEPDSYDRSYAKIMSEVNMYETAQDDDGSLENVRESLSGQFDLAARGDALRERVNRIATESMNVLNEHRTFYSDRRLTEPFSPVRPNTQI
jgi:protein SFI1